MGLAEAPPDWDPASGFSAWKEEAFEGEEPAEASGKPRGGDDFRSKFLQQLAYRKVWVPPEVRPPKHQTVLIFDWDDTLLCTSWLQANDGAESDAKDRVLDSIAEAAKRLLEQAVSMGHTFIITNAQSGWVEYSAAKWVPALVPVLAKVQIISARDQHESSFPNEVHKWKIQAFLDVQKRFDSKVITNLVVLGDADYEMTAASVMGGQFETALVKTIKLRQNPTPMEHLKQLELINTKLDQITTAARRLRIFLERKG